MFFLTYFSISSIFSTLFYLKNWRFIMLSLKKIYLLILILLSFSFTQTAFCQIFGRSYYNNYYNNYNRNYYNNNNYYRQNTTAQPQSQSQPQAQQQLPSNKTSIPPKYNTFYRYSFITSGVFASSSQYKILIPQTEESNGTYGLLIYLHGDEANDYYNNWILNQLVPIAKKKNLILVSVLAPGYIKRWYVGARAKAEYLRTLIESHLFNLYNIDTNRIYLTGSSGGSQFITGIFVAEFASNYGGGAFPTCGGATPFRAYNVIPKITNTMKKGFKLFYYTTTGDFLYPQVSQSKALYSKLGLKVGGYHPYGGHCRFNMSTAVEAAFNFFESDK